MIKKIIGVIAILASSACIKQRIVLVPVPCKLDIPQSDLTCRVPPLDAHAGQRVECAEVAILKLKQEVKDLRAGIDACNKAAETPAPSPVPASTPR
jgi:hypothetical protein